MWDRMLFGGLAWLLVVFSCFSFEACVFNVATCVWFVLREVVEHCKGVVGKVVVLCAKDVAEWKRTVGSHPL